VETCYGVEVADESIRVNVTLSTEHGEKLARMARRTHVREGTLASSLLSHAIDEADPDADQIVALLDRIPGAWERIEAGVADAEAGRTVPFTAH
jgi:predicted transcriptional regulator